VVVAISSVMVRLAGAQLMRGPGDVVREESERLRLFLRSAREEAILQGRVFRLRRRRESYRFLSLSGNGPPQGPRARTICSVPSACRPVS